MVTSSPRRPKMAEQPTQPRGTPSAGLPNVSIVTPSRRAYSADPPSRGSTRRSVHTPLDNSTSRDLLNSIRRGQSASTKKNAPTPHARAAIRELDLRRAAVFTPGKNRRRSLRDQRETPRALLRNLSRVLAPVSKVVATSSPRDGPSTIASIQEEEEDDELPIDKPRLSLPLELDDDSDLQPPRSAGLEEENYTMQSMELPRRAISEQPLSRLSRGSLGSIPMSDLEHNDINEDEIGIDSGYFPRIAIEDLGGAEDASFERLDEVDSRRGTLGFDRDSGFGVDLAPDANDTTFMMNLNPPASNSPSALIAIEDEELDDQAEEPEEPGEESAVAAEADVASGEANPRSRKAGSAKRRLKLSRHGIEYPSLPPALIKRLAQTFARTSGVSKSKIGPDTITALSQATDWFFEQLGEDLQAYSKHAGRKTIDETDVITLMRRQRQVGPSSTPFSLAQKFLPRELLQEIRMPVPVLPKTNRKKSNVNAEG